MKSFLIEAMHGLVLTAQIGSAVADRLMVEEYSDADSCWLSSTVKAKRLDVDESLI